MRCERVGGGVPGIDEHGWQEVLVPWPLAGRKNEKNELRITKKDPEALQRPTFDSSERILLVAYSKVLCYLLSLARHFGAMALILA